MKLTCEFANILRFDVRVEEFSASFGMSKMIIKQGEKLLQMPASRLVSSGDAEELNSSMGRF